ncbi:MAG: helix-turn-helix transcriptional regulator [Bacteroidota bacterium]
MYEFFWTTDKNRLIVHDIRRDEYMPLSYTSHKDLVTRCEEKLQQDYPVTWSALKEEYPNPSLSFDPWGIRVRRINRFLKCNFSMQDNLPDIDDDWNFDFERVPCPLRGECDRGYCSPKLTTNLTKREIEVISLHIEGMTQQEIGDRLYISGRTVQNHIYKIYQKLGFNGKPHPETLLINYAYKNKLIS